MQSQIGSCTVDQISVAIACPVVAIHPERNEIIIYGGGVHFSKDRLEHPSHGTIYGLVVENKVEGWGALADQTFLTRISQEHGTIHAPDDFISNICLGDIIKILPIHSCMSADLYSTYTTTKGQIISRITH